MTPERWSRLKEIFTQALDREGAERERFLIDACGEDAGLLQAARGLLRQHDDAGDFLSSPAVDAVGEDHRPLFEPGQFVAGRFRIEKFLARGGMGEVYQAEDQALGQRVALKAIQRVFKSEQAVQFLKQEIQAARRVTHQNVCRIYDLAEHGDPPVNVLTMELLDGPTLERHLKEHGPFTQAQALPLIAQIGAGLQAAHDAGVIHRDFKAGNVILAGGPSAWRPVITDFGLALSPHSQSQESSPHGGTPGYMAPEQVEGKPATAATDVYAFGVAIAAMLGVRPSDLPRAGLESKKLGAWRRTIERCLESDPARRYQRPAEVVRALSSVGRGVRLAALAAGLLLAAMAVLYWRETRPSSSGFVARKLAEELQEDTFWDLSRDGRWVAATDWSDGQLVVRDMQHNVVRRLTTASNPPDQVYEAVISPDDSRIAYRRFKEDATYELRIVNSQGDGERLLLQDPAVTDAVPRDWLPGGSQVVVTANWTDGRSGLGLLSAETGMVTPVSTAGEAREAGTTVFSAATNELFFNARQSPDQSGRDIFAVGLNGQNQRRLVSGPSDDYIAGVSPDGRRLVFISDRSANPGIWTLELNTRESAPQLAVADLGFVSPLGITPEGSLVYKVALDYTTVYAAALDLAARSTVEPPRVLGLGGYLSWSRDGAELAYLANSNRIRPTLVFWNRASNEQRELPLRLLNLYRPQWRTSNTLAGFGAGQGPDGYLDVDVRTGQANLLMDRATAQTGSEGVWSTDGNIWYSRFDGNRSGLFRYDLRTRQREVIFTPGPGTGLSQENMALSPDGRTLAFQVQTRPFPGTGTLMLLPTAGGEPRPLLTVQSPEMFAFGAFTWLPDSSALLVARTRRDTQDSELWLVPVNGAPPERIDFPSMRVRNLRLNQDGRTIAFFAGAMNFAEVRILENFLPAP